MVPLHWEHRSETEDIIGYVDPASMVEGEHGLTVKGKVDLETERGREVWRLLRQNVAAFSFGFLTVKSHDEDGVRILDQVDVFEVTITASPANNRTRVLDLKSASRADDPLGPIFSDFFSGKTTVSQAVQDRDRRKRQEVEELAAELKAAKEAKAVTVRIHTFEV